VKHWNYIECEYCGCNLDYGERCTCLDELEAQKREVEKNLDRSEPQVRFRFDEMERKTA
jgi:hypothetical protein